VRTKSSAVAVSPAHAVGQRGVASSPAVNATSGAAGLPTDPKNLMYEDFVGACLSALGYFVEPRIRQFIDKQNVLELDAVISNVADPPDRILVEAKSGNWGFADVFKVYGWRSYLGNPRGFVVSRTSDPTKMKLSGHRRGTATSQSSRIRTRGNERRGHRQSQRRMQSATAPLRGRACRSCRVEPQRSMRRRSHWEGSGPGLRIGSRERVAADDRTSEITISDKHHANRTKLGPDATPRRFPYM
jgi:hypothetical protein